MSAFYPQSLLPDPNLVGTGDRRGQSIQMLDGEPLILIKKKKKKDTAN